MKYSNLPEYVDKEGPKTIVIKFEGYTLIGKIVSISEEENEIHVEMTYI